MGQNTSSKGSVRVLFGKRTGLDTASGEFSISDTEAYHFTVEHYDPTTQLQVWRTYFLDLNTKNIRKV